MGEVEELMKELEFTSNNFQRQAQKCEKRVKLEKLNLRKAIQKGNTDAARIHDKNILRRGKEKINYLRLSTKLDEVVARSDAKVNMMKISKSLGSIVKLLQSTGGQFEEQQLVNIIKVQAELMKSSSSMQQQAALGMKNNIVKVDEDDLIRRFNHL